MNTGNRRFDIKSVLLGAVVGACIMVTVAAASGTRANWEYKVVQGKVLGNEATLDERETSRLCREDSQSLTLPGVA